MSVSRLAFALALAALSTPAFAGDGPPPPPDAGERAHARATRALAGRCDRKVAAAQTNTDLKLRAAEALDCKKAAAEALANKARKGVAAEALKAEQAAWEAFEAQSCALAEELVWVDLERGTRDDGTARGYARLGCGDALAVERYTWLTAARAGDLRVARARIAFWSARAEEVAGQLERVAAAATAWQQAPDRPVPDADAGARRSAEDWAELAQGARAVADLARKAGEASCAAWPALTKALGGPEACAAQLARAYLGQGPGPSTFAD